jgi:hypothetical protein
MGCSWRKVAPDQIQDSTGDRLNISQSMKVSIHCSGRNILLAAVKEGNINEVKSLIDIGLDCNVVGEDCFNTPLISAIRHGHFHIAYYLLGLADIDVNYTNNFVGNALLHACYSNNTDLVELLILRGADPNLYACYPFAIDNIGETLTLTAFSAACMKGNPIIVSKFIEAGEDINTAFKIECHDSKGGYNRVTYPLFIACEYGHMDLLKYICNLDTNICVSDREGNSIFHRLSHVKDDHLIVEIFYTITKFFPLEILELVSLSNINGDAPIHLASANGNRELVGCLIKCGCDMNLVNSTTGKTALDIAVERGDKALISLLSQQNLSQSIRERFQKTASELHSEDVGGYTFDEIRSVEIVFGNVSQFK